MKNLKLFVLVFLFLSLVSAASVHALNNGIVMASINNSKPMLLSMEHVSTIQTLGPDKEFALMIDELLEEKVHFTFGLGWGGNEFLGGIRKDGFGYPKNALGLNDSLGMSYTWIHGTPSKQRILYAIQKVVEENGEEIKTNKNELIRLTRQELEINYYNYFRFGTALILYPIVVEYGWMVPVNNIVRFQIGLGLPWLINCGVNFDF